MKNISERNNLIIQEFLGLVPQSKIAVEYKITKQHVNEILQKYLDNDLFDILKYCKLEINKCPILISYKIESGRQRARKWYKNNLEKIKEYSARYYYKNFKKIKKKRLEYYHRNKDKFKICNKIYYRKNKIKIFEKQKQWLANNREKYNNYQNNYYHNVKKLKKQKNTKIKLLNNGK